MGATFDSEDYLAHHGILGMKWGIRRYQNPDGSLTEEGKKRYGTSEGLRAAYDAKAKRKADTIRSKSGEEKAAKYESKYQTWMKQRDEDQALKRKIAEEKDKAAAADKEAEEKAIEEAKKKAIASGDPKEISKYLDTMDTKNIKDVNDRIKAMEDLKGKVKPGVIDRLKDTVKNATMDAVNKKITNMIYESINLKEQHNQSPNRDFSNDLIKGAKENADKYAQKMAREAAEAGKSLSEQQDAYAKAHKEYMDGIVKRANDVYSNTAEFLRDNSSDKKEKDKKESKESFFKRKEKSENKKEEAKKDTSEEKKETESPVSKSETPKETPKESPKEEKKSSFQFVNPFKLKTVDTLINTPVSDVSEVKRDYNIVKGPTIKGSSTSSDSKARLMESLKAMESMNSHNEKVIEKAVADLDEIKGGLINYLKNKK